MIAYQSQNITKCTAIFPSFVPLIEKVKRKKEKPDTYSIMNSIITHLSQKSIFTKSNSKIFISSCLVLVIYGTWTSCKEKFCKENFQTGFVVAGGGFLSYWNHQLIKLEEEK